MWWYWPACHILHWYKSYDGDFQGEYNFLHIFLAIKGISDSFWDLFFNYLSFSTSYIILVIGSIINPPLNFRCKCHPPTYLIHTYTHRYIYVIDTSHSFTIDSGMHTHVTKKYIHYQSIGKQWDTGWHFNLPDDIFIKK